MLRNVNFDISAGQTVALVGTSGCGKSTIISMLLGFYPPDTGKILVDGVDMTELDADNFRSKIAYVTQEPELFSSSITDNIMYGASDATKEQVIQAAKDANAHDFISEFNEQYETIVGDKGSKISGGQVCPYM